ncbi:MAG: hypothetical protein WAL86_01975, partial [Candidatus Acidiferrales bacterium]
TQMRRFISETAKYGDITRGPRIVTEQTREEMRKILAEIQSGQFAREWIAEDASGRKNYNALLEKGLNHPVEKVGRDLRERMSWLKPKIERAQGAR